jgi:hypothetical protein
MTKKWEFNGGYGLRCSSHDYVYKYVGPKPWPSNKKWKMTSWDAHTRKSVTLYFKTLHEAISSAAGRMF